MDPHKKSRRRNNRTKKKRLLFVEESEFGFGSAAHFLAFLIVGLILVYLLIRFIV